MPDSKDLQYLPRTSHIGAVKDIRYTLLRSKGPMALYKAEEPADLVEPIWYEIRIQGPTEKNRAFQTVVYFFDAMLAQEYFDA
jgi:hypothetical protein